MTYHKISEESSHPCLLIVDDDAAVRASLRLMLEDQYRILEASGVDEAMSLLQQDEPDLVTMDLRMPKKSGLDGLRMIREQNRDLPVVLLTAFASLDSACDAMRLGASDYLQKPCSPSELLATIEKNLHHRSPKAAANRHAPPQPAAFQEPWAGNEMEILGKASMALAHDLASPLLIAGLTTSLCKQKLEELTERHPGSAELTSHLDHIEQLVTWCANLIKQWRGLVDNGDWMNEVCLIQDLIHEAMTLTKPHALLYQVKLTMEPTVVPIPVEGNRVQLVRAIANIIMNAIQASANKGREVRVFVETETVGATIKVQDNGAGIPADRLAYLSARDPFDDSGFRGSGLGLFITRWVARNHRGEFRMKSQESVGTTAEFFLPLAL